MLFDFLDCHLNLNMQMRLLKNDDFLAISLRCVKKLPHLKCFVYFGRLSTYHEVWFIKNANLMKKFKVEKMSHFSSIFSKSLTT